MEAVRREEEPGEEAMKRLEDKRRFVEEEDFEKLVEDLDGYKHNKQNRTKREGDEELHNHAPKKKKQHKSKDKRRSVEEDEKIQSDAPKKKKKKHKSEDNKRRSVEEDEKIQSDAPKMKKKEHKSEDNKRRSVEEDEKIQSDAPKMEKKKKKKKHKSEKNKGNKQRSVEEEDIEKHVEDLEGDKQEKQNRKRKLEEVKVQNHAIKKKKKKLKDGKQLKELEEDDQDVDMEEEKKRKGSLKFEKTNEQQELEHEHQRKKKKKSKKRKERINNDKNSNEESMEGKSKNKKKGEKLQSTKSSENQKLLENVPDKENELKSKRSKKKNTKAHPEGVLPYDEDVNPIHFDWNPSEEIKQKFNMRQGRWTKQEEKLLQENMEQYLLENDLDDPSKLIFAHLHSDSDEEKKWKEFAKTTNFYRKLGKGLNRSIFLIYRKVLRLFNQGNYIGKFTESEDRELEKLVTIHGKKWEKIGRIMGRSGLAVRHRYSRISGTRGKWEDSEVDLLKEAVRKITNTKEGEEVFTNINWTAVASIVKTRNAYQCRRKWLSQICWKECKSAPCRKWDSMDDLKLIKLVYESSATGEYDIDWNELHKDFEMARSPAWLSAKFKVLLKKYCNSIDLENTDFEDIMDYLYNEKRVVLEDKGCDHQDSISE